MARSLIDGHPSTAFQSRNGPAPTTAPTAVNGSTSRQSRRRATSATTTASATDVLFKALLKERRVPALRIVPLNVFDAAGYRLGYGGGYFDRTLAALDPAPTCVGVAFELARAGSTHPQPHNKPMDWVVTGARAINCAANRKAAADGRAPDPGAATA